MKIIISTPSRFWAFSLAGDLKGKEVSEFSITASLLCKEKSLRTQLPYAFVVAIVCILLGDVPSAFGLSPYISLLLIAILLVGVIYAVGRNVDNSQEMKTA